MCKTITVCWMVKYTSESTFKVTMLLYCLLNTKYLSFVFIVQGKLIRLIIKLIHFSKVLVAQVDIIIT